MNRLLFLSISVIALPFLYLLWARLRVAERLQRLKKDAARRRRQIDWRRGRGVLLEKAGTLAQALGRQRPASEGVRIFTENFEKHFHPKNGLFSEDSDLRKRVYRHYLKPVRNGTGYKQLWRQLAGDFYPKPGAHSRWPFEERKMLFQYFQNNFIYPDNLRGDE